MGSRIKTFIAAATWPRQRPLAEAKGPTIIPGPTYAADNGPGPHDHLDTAPSPPFNGPSRPSSSRGNSSSPTRLRRDSLLDRVPEEGRWEPAPAEDDDEPVDDYDEDEVEWELEQMGLYRGEHSALISFAWPASNI
jgi:hypothetical protein